MVIELLLLGILVVELIRLLSLIMPKGKKQYLKQRIGGVDQSIWDTEFQRNKAKEIKEDLRVQMTGLKSKQAILLEEIEKDKVANPPLTKETREKLLSKEMSAEEKVKMNVDDIRRRKEDELEKMGVKINKLIYGVGRPKLKEDGTVDEVETDKLPRENDTNIKDMELQIGFLNEKIQSLHELKMMLKQHISKGL